MRFYHIKTEYTAHECVFAVYILTFISGIGSWQVFQSELGIPFKCSAVVMYC